MLVGEHLLFGWKFNVQRICQQLSNDITTIYVTFQLLSPSIKTFLSISLLFIFHLCACLQLNSTAKDPNVRPPLVSQLSTSSIDPDQLLATARTLNSSTIEEALNARNQSEFFEKLTDQSTAQLNTMAPIERKQIDLTPLKEANVPVFFIVGGPGSGKGTQCEKIVAKYGLTHLSSGDLLREEVKSGSPRGGQLTKMMQAGELVPLEIVLDLVKEAILKAVKNGSRGFLIDGYPREVKQGDQFEEEIQPCKLVIFFDVSEETLVNRCLQRGLTSGRVDDNVNTIKKRLQTFNTATQPVVDHYIQKQKLVRIKGEGSVEEIFVEVSDHLQKHLQ